MQIDVLYRVPKDLCWQYINRFVSPESINLVLFNTCLDNYITKKTIWNAVSRIMHNGILCIRAHPENLSYVIELLKKQNMLYKVIYFYSSNENEIYVYVLGYKNYLFKPDIETLINISQPEDIASKLVNLCNFGDIVMCIGDSALSFVDKIKILGRQVVGFGNDPIWFELARTQGVRGTEV